MSEKWPEFRCMNGAEVFDYLLPMIEQRLYADTSTMYPTKLYDIRDAHSNYKPTPIVDIDDTLYDVMTVLGYHNHHSLIVVDDTNLFTDERGVLDETSEGILQWEDFSSYFNEFIDGRDYWYEANRGPVSHCYNRFPLEWAVQRAEILDKLGNRITYEHTIRYAIAHKRRIYYRNEHVFVNDPSRNYVYEYYSDENISYPIPPYTNISYSSNVHEYHVYKRYTVYDRIYLDRTKCNVRPGTKIKLVCGWSRDGVISGYDKFRDFFGGIAEDRLYVYAECTVTDSPTVEFNILWPNKKPDIFDSISPQKVPEYYSEGLFGRNDGFMLIYDADVGDYYGHPDDNLAILEKMLSKPK